MEEHAQFPDALQGPVEATGGTREGGGGEGGGGGGGSGEGGGGEGEGEGEGEHGQKR